MNSLATPAACRTLGGLRTASRAWSTRFVGRPRPRAVRVVAGKEAKDQQTGGGSAEASKQLASSVPEEQASRPISTPSESAASSGGDPANDGPPLVVRLLGLIAAVMAVISVFYSIVFYAGAGMFYLIGDNITFTRKDFIPYSERRALEKEAEEAQLAREAGADQTALPPAPDTKFSESFLPDSKKK